MQLTEMLSLIVKGFWETLYMTLGSTLVAYAIGLPLGLLLILTDPQGLRPMPVFNRVLGVVEEIFHRPKSMAARQLIVPSSQVPPKESFGEGRFLRITFDGRERTDSPLVAEMVLHTGVPVSIVFADTRSLNGRLYGQMILQAPDDEAVMEKMLEFLRRAEVSFEEVI